MMKLNKFNTTGQEMQLLEAYAAKPGVLQRVPAIYKIVFILCFILSVVSIPGYNWPGLIPFAAFPVAGMFLVGLPWKIFLKRLLLVIPFVVMFGIFNIFLDNRTVSYAASFTMNGGTASFIVLLLKAVLTVGAVLLLVATTPMNAIAGALAFLGIPALFVMQLILTWRYAGLLARQASRMSDACRLRGGGNRGIRINIWPQFIGSFLLRSINRAGTVADAMNCRLFDAKNIRYEKPAFKKHEFLAWFTACCLCPGLRMWPGL